MLHVEGSLRTDKFERDGRTQYYTYVLAYKVTPVSLIKSPNPQPYQQPYQQPRQQQYQRTNGRPQPHGPPQGHPQAPNAGHPQDLAAPPLNDDDIPF